MNRTLLFLGLILILVGMLALMDNLFDIRLWRFFWPAVLILLGLYLIVRPRIITPAAGSRQKLLGTIRREGSFALHDEEIWIGVGDVELDLRQSEILEGTTHLRVRGFVADVDVWLPEGVGVELRSASFVTDADFLGEKRGGFLSALVAESHDYGQSPRRVIIDVGLFVGDVSIRRR